LISMNYADVRIASGVAGSADTRYSRAL